MKLYIFLFGRHEDPCPYWKVCVFTHHFYYIHVFITFTFMHLADAFIQSDLQCIAFRLYIYCQCVCSVVNSVLLKCRKLRREDQETSYWIVSRISLFYDMSCYL